MSKTNDTSKPEALDNPLDDHGALADSELDGVNGGNKPPAQPQPTLSKNAREVIVR